MGYLASVFVFLAVVLFALRRGLVSGALATFFVLMSAVVFVVLFGQFGCTIGRTFFCSRGVIPSLALLPAVILVSGGWGLGAVALARKEALARALAVLATWAGLLAAAGLWTLWAAAHALSAEEADKLLGILKPLGYWGSVCAAVIAAAFACRIFAKQLGPEASGLLLAAPILGNVVAPAVYFGWAQPREYYTGVLYGLIVYCMAVLLIRLEQRPAAQVNDQPRLGSET
ncbi:MAG: hypothetical protein ACKVP7_04820 [Hyphomicrobiaceae bacterium]